MTVPKVAKPSNSLSRFWCNRRIGIRCRHPRLRGNRLRCGRCLRCRDSSPLLAMQTSVLSCPFGPARYTSTEFEVGSSAASSGTLIDRYLTCTRQPPAYHDMIDMIARVARSFLDRRNRPFRQARARNVLCECLPSGHRHPAEPPVSERHRRTQLGKERA